MRKLAIATLTLGVLLTMGGLRAADLRWARAQALKAAESRAANLSLIISAYLGEAFAAGDASLRQLALRGRRVGAAAPPSTWGPSLASAKAGLTGIGAISVIDREGVIRHSTRPEIVGESRGDQEVLRRAFSGSGDDLLVGTPFPSLERPPQMLIPIGRRVTGADGSTEGAVFASFIPAVPRGFLRQVDVGVNGTVWVFHPDGVVLFREPSSGNPIGESARENAIFAAAIRARASGTLHGTVAEGGPVLVSAFHSTPTPPLIVAVSLDEREVLADWTREARSAALVFGGLALTLIAIVAVLFRQMDARSRVERALADTQRQEAARLRDANDRLERALQREQGARREAEAASALKDQFLMTISHELRTPLTAIYGWARMLVDGAVSERQKESALRTIERNARAQARLVDDLLDVSGIVGGKLRLEVRTIDIAPVVQNAMDTVKPAADAKGIQLETTFDPAVTHISADPERLQQIIWNLLANAVKFTPAGGLVRIAVSRAADAIEIAVSDTGAGISPGFLPYVFDRFRQEDAGTERRYGGLGLGLAIVRNLVELHGGSVTAHSEGPGRGSTFVVRLPGAAAPAAADRPPARSLAAPASLAGVRVLVVDDDPEARALFETILERAGASVTAVASAAAALTALQNRSVDVLLSDIEMPEVDGYSLVHQSLAIAQGRGERLTAIAVTAYSRPEDEARSLAAGYVRHVQKPIDPATLVIAVRQALDATAAAGGRRVIGPT